MNIKLKKAIVINRISKTIKSPYLADIKIGNTIELAHNPGLGLGALLINETKIMVSSCEDECRKSKYTIELVYVDNVGWIGSNSYHSNKIFANFINKFTEFDDYTIEKAEIKLLNSRLDFLLVNNKNEKFYVEVKNVSSVDNTQNNELVTAIFPDGYKKNNAKYISDRAYKHLKELIKLNKKGFRAALVFIIQRDDPDIFKPNYIQDKNYAEKLKEAYDKGVEIYAYKFQWSIKNNIGSCKFIQKIPVIFNK